MNYVYNKLSKVSFSDTDKGNSLVTLRENWRTCKKENPAVHPGDHLVSHADAEIWTQATVVRGKTVFEV